MGEDRQELQNLDVCIIQTLEKNKPNTVEQLVTQVRMRSAVPEKKILERILRLRDQGKVLFKENLSPFTFKSFLLSSKSIWYWIITAISVAVTVLMFIVPENAYPVVYALHVLGSIFVLFLPGYALIKALFLNELDNMKRIGLSIGMSAAVVTIAALFLNYTPWGITTTTVTVSLLAITGTLATAGLIREYQTETTAAA